MGWVGGIFCSASLASRGTQKTVFISSRSATQLPSQLVSSPPIEYLRHHRIKLRGLACLSQSQPSCQFLTSLAIYIITTDLMHLIQQYELAATLLKTDIAQNLRIRRRASHGSVRWKYMGGHRGQCTRSAGLRQRLPREPATATRTQRRDLCEILQHTCAT